MDKKLLWWTFAVSTGGPVRAKIVSRLKERPSNANQLAKEFNLAYPTIRYHLNILMENNIIVSTGRTTIQMYFLSDQFEEDWTEFEKICEKLKKEKKC